jgi:hypothetical protein
MKHTHLSLRTGANALFIFSSLLLVLNSCAKAGCNSPATQVAIARVDSMPCFPQPYKILDWKQKAIDLDNYLFDLHSKLPTGPVIWLDGKTGFGIFTAIHDSRQGSDVNKGKFYESLVSFAAVLGAGLIGIDKTNQDGSNYVKLLQNHFNTGGINGSAEWNLMTNVPDGGWDDWWYEVFPNVLFYYICDVFPHVEHADSLQRLIAEQFYKADSILNGNYDYSYFDYGKMQGMRNHIPCQQDVAGGHGYVLLAAYQKFGDEKYLAGAKSAISALHNQKESRFYEILLPVGVYTAARLNAEYGTNYDITKMLNWIFEGCKNPDGRYGWGIICDRWGDYDVSGLQGSLTDGGGYAFLMNSIKTAIPLVPLVKYQPQYAAAIGKWMLNNVNACRLFFPDEIDDAHQYLPGMKNLTNGIVAYEGLRKTNPGGKYETERLKNVSPVALGDGPNWTPDNPPETMFSIYSTAPIGVFGAMVDTTNVPYILRLDCNATDFYAGKTAPVYLYYNPYDEEKTVNYRLSAGNSKIDLFDIVSKKQLAKNIPASSTVRICEIKIPAKSAVVVRLDEKNSSHECTNKLLVH